MSNHTEKAVTINILGKEYHVSCPAGEEHSLRQAAHTLHERMASIKASGKVVGVERIAVMAALNISHELLQRKTELQSVSQETETRISLLTQKLELLLADQQK